MVQRILDIIKHEGLTASQFAEMIGIQRSAISHLESGRNKPSLELIQKILARFPHINLEWIMTGKGNMTGKEAADPGIQKQPDTLPPTEKEFIIPVKEKVNNRLPDEEPVQHLTKKALPPAKQVEKIVFFFKDQSFREYYPGN